MKRAPNGFCRSYRLGWKYGSAAGGVSELGVQRGGYRAAAVIREVSSAPIKTAVRQRLKLYPGIFTYCLGLERPPEYSLGRLLALSINTSRSL